jgi:hypothetical protein
VTALLAGVWFLAGTMAGWAVSTLRTAVTMSRAREQMRQEIRCWQAETERSRAVTDRLAQEKESWAAGVRQGRDDVITIVPLLIAAQQRLIAGAAGSGAATSKIDNCA